MRKDDDKPTLDYGTNEEESLERQKKRNDFWATISAELFVGLALPVILIFGFLLWADGCD